MAVRMLHIIPFTLAMITVVLLLVVMVAGASPGILDNFFFVKISPSELYLPSALSQSRYLQALSQMTSQDLIGPPITSMTSNLAGNYTVHLFTRCAHALGNTTCSTPSIRAVIDPLQDFHLENTMLGASDGSYLPPLDSAMSFYRSIGTFIGCAFILAVVFVIASVTINLVHRTGIRTAWAGVILAFLAFSLLLAATVVGGIAFHRIISAINEAYGPSGIHALSGRLLVPGYIAVVTSFATWVLLLFLLRREQARQKMELLGHVVGKSPSQSPSPDQLEYPQDIPPRIRPRMISALNIYDRSDGENQQTPTRNVMLPPIIDVPAAIRSGETLFSSESGGLRYSYEPEMRSGGTYIRRVPVPSPVEIGPRSTGDERLEMRETGVLRTHDDGERGHQDELGSPPSSPLRRMERPVLPIRISSLPRPASAQQEPLEWSPQSPQRPQTASSPRRSARFSGFTPTLLPAGRLGGAGREYSDSGSPK